MKRLLLLMSLVLTLAACGNSDSQTEEMRIISLIPSNTEIINELIGVDALVGVTTVDNYPESLEASDIEKIDTFNIDPEALITLEPTHIVSHESINENSKAQIDQVVEATNAEVLVVDDAEDIDGVFDSIDEIGEFLNVEDKSDALVSSLKDDYEDVVNRFKDETPKSAFVLISPAPDFYVAGNDTFLDSMLQDVKIDNVFDDIDGFPLVDIEAIVSRNPEYLISAIGVSEEELQEMIEDTKGFKDMAFTNSDKQCVPNVDLISRPGPRIISGIEDVAECIHD